MKISNYSNQLARSEHDTRQDLMHPALTITCLCRCFLINLKSSCPVTNE